MSNRLTDSIAKTVAPPWAVHYSELDPKTVLPAPVVEAVKRCMEGRSFDGLTDWYLRMNLYRIAGLDAQARALAQQRIAHVSGDTSVEHAFVLDSIVQSYLKSAPRNFSEAKQYIPQFIHDASRLPLRRSLWGLIDVLEAAVEFKDTIASREFGRQTLEFIHQLDKKKVPSDFGEIVGELTVATFDAVYRDSMFKALRISDEAYTKFVSAKVDEIVAGDYYWKGRIPPTRLPGEVIRGDYWFPKEIAGVTYPRPGRITLLVNTRILGTGQFIGPSNDESVIAIVHRLQKKFPELDVVLTAATQGYFNVIGPLEPNQEAVLLDSVWRRETFGPQVVLTVNNIPWWRLPGLDRRRINEVPEESLWEIRGRELQIIDEHKVVWIPTSLRTKDIRTNLHHRYERWAESMLTVLFDRLKGQ